MVVVSNLSGYKKYVQSSDALAAKCKDMLCMRRVSPCPLFKRSSFHPLTPFS